MLEAPRVHLRAEEHHALLRLTIGFEPLENRLRIVEHVRGGGHRERVQLLDARLSPGAGAGLADEKVRRALAAELQVGGIERIGRGRLSGQLFDFDHVRPRRRVTTAVAPNLPYSTTPQMFDPLPLARRLIDIPSPTEQEREMATFLHET